ncbi:MAG TPA: DUF222 domain-containing protein [Acidimicrobiales bacterium]|nr:DUF222 domain-containing protein [Acidimicrobiales bacterium]
MLEDLVAAVDEVVAADPATLADGEALEVLHRQLARLEAVATRAAAAADAAGAWAGSGARSCSAWLAWRCSLPAGTARRRVRLGRTLRHLPATEAAWLAGAVGAEHVSVLDRARTPATAEALARDEALLVGRATDLRFAAFARLVSYWSQHADPDGAEGEAEAGYRARRVHLSPGFEGTWVLDGVLDPVSGAIVARARHGAGAGADHLARTPAQRRCDALVELARRAQATPPGPAAPSRCSASTWAGRPWPGASASSPTAPWWPRGRSWPG